MNETILQSENLCKSYKKFKALDNVSFSVNKGDMYALIGRNGAGKTTIMKIISQLTECTSGNVKIFGKDLSQLGDDKRRIGCLIENPAFYTYMTGYENLKYYAIQKRMSDMGRIDEILKLVGLYDSKDKKCRKYSLGMKQRLGIAIAMLDYPDIVVLDEPINGIDAIGIAQMRETFKRLNTEYGMTFIISSHILSELYVTANKFLFIEQGSVIKELTKEELDNECRKCIFIRTSDVTKAINIIEKDLSLSNIKVIDKTELRIYDLDVDTSALNMNLVRGGVMISEIGETGISLEEYFKQMIREVK